MVSYSVSTLFPGSSESERPTSLSRQNSGASTSGASSSQQQQQQQQAVPQSPLQQPPSQQQQPPTPQPPVEFGPHNIPAVKLEEKERRNNALAILKLLSDHVILQPHLLQLLSARNAEGCTPFMQAVCNRAYQAAVIVLDVAKKMSSVIKEDRSEVNQEVA